MTTIKSWVTLATNDSYALGALVLAHSLKNVGTKHQLTILITPGVTASMKEQIHKVFNDVKVVDVLDSKDEAHLALMSRPELGITFTKLHCWTLINYEKCVFLDADTLVLQNCDELFDREELSAAPDPGWPDCFNSGVFVFKPSLDTFKQLLDFAKSKGSFDGGDQGLLNLFFNDWAHKDISKHLSFTYNVVWSSTYSYLPALKQFGQNMKIVHFIASSKPWLQKFDVGSRIVTSTSGGSGLQALLQFWWDLFCKHVHPVLSTQMIESRLSSCYSHQSSTIYHFNDIPSFYDIPVNETLNCEPPQEHYYNFTDPWEEYIGVTNEQNKIEIEEKKIMSDENVSENFLECDREIYSENFSEINCDSRKQIENYIFQNDVVEELNKFEHKKRSDEYLENNSDFQGQVNIEYNCPACFTELPNNNTSSLSVNNSSFDTPKSSKVVTAEEEQEVVDGGLAAQFANLPLGEKSADQQALEDFLRRQSWEHGNVDYLGKDSFSNIWAKINETLETPSESKVEPNVTLTTPQSLEIVHTQEIKPLKSALKKTSTTSQPDHSELTESIETTTKQLEKLDFKKDDSEESKVPLTPTVTSPTPPTTPSTQLQESPKPIEPSKDIPTPVDPPKEILKTVKPESIKSEPAEEVKESVQQTNEPVMTEEKHVSNEPPVPPKRTHKPSGLDDSKNVPPPAQEK